MKALVLEALQGLRSRRATTLVAVGGLTLALTACVLVAMLAIALSRPDPNIPDPQRTVPLERISRAVQDGLDIRHDGRLQPTLLILADPEVASLLGIEALSGDTRATLGRHDGIAITVDLMRKLWGDAAPEQVIGRQIEARGSAKPKEFLYYTVGAVIPDVDPRSPIGDRNPMVGNAVAFVGFDSQAALPGFADPSLHNVGWVFARLPPGGSTRQIGDWIRDAMRSSPMYAQLPTEMTAGREPAYFRGLTLSQETLEGDPRWQIVTTLGAASMLLLVLAVLNCMNLQTATLSQRRRETALRLSVGADSLHLLRLWGTEVLLGLLFAAVAALLIAWWLAPTVAQWMQLSPEYAVGNPIPAEVVLGLALVVVVLLPLTLVVPAWRALRRAPAPALQGRTPSEGPWGKRMRQWLLSFQLLGALVLLSMAGIIAVQQQHVLNAERGFDTRNRLWLGVLVNPEEVPSMDGFLAALEGHPAVKHWAFSYVPGGGGGKTEQHESGSQRKQTLRVNTVSAGFFDTYGMKILAGRPQVGSGETNVVIDAKAAHLLGFATPQAAVGELLRAGEEGNESRRIVAVVNDVKMESARDPAMPQAFVLSDRTQWDISIYGDDAATLRHTVEELFKAHGPPLVYDIQPADKLFADRYMQERKLTQLLGTCSMLAIFVAMLGAYALVADTLRRRRTELILHRLHGASDMAILRQVARELASPLLIAVAIALPLAVLIGRMYLGGFVEKAGAGVGIALPIVAAALAIAGITAVSAVRYFRQALALQPMEALR